MARPLLRDLYLRMGTPRPVHEARASMRLRERGFATPAVLAGAVYLRGPFYRADIVSEYIPRSFDLAAGLFGDGLEDEEERVAALQCSGALVSQLARAGIEHADLNARNILLFRKDEALSAVPLDLDRCRTTQPPAGLSPARMLRRLERSLAKIGGHAGAPLSETERAELRCFARRSD